MALKGPGLVLPGDLPCHRLARLAFAGLPLLSPLARRVTAGSEWPGRQPRPVAPFLPGGDNTAPLVAQQSIEDLGQSVVVANDGGAGTVKAIAERGVPADGYTILYGTPGTLITDPLPLANLPYDAERGFVSVSMAVCSRRVLAVRPSAPARSVAELITLTKARSDRPSPFRHRRRQPLGRPSCCVSRPASASPTSPHRGSNSSVQDATAGQMPMAIDGLNVPILLIPGVALGQRAAQLPRVTATAETPQGIGVKVVNDLAVRSGTPQPIIERLSKAVVRPAAAPRNADADADADAGAGHARRHQGRTGREIVMSEDVVTLEVRDYVAVATLNRPPVNAVNWAMRDRIIEIMDQANDRGDIRVVLLTAQGDVFCAGADLKQRPDPNTPGQYWWHNRLTRETGNSIKECAKPVIAAVNGAALGAGFGLAAACDIMLASENAVFGMPEIDVGLAGGAAMLSELFSKSKVRRMMFTGQRLPAAELYRLGVVEACLPRERLMEEAMALATEIAGKAPLGIKYAKLSCNMVELMPAKDAYRFEQNFTYELSRTEDAQEARKATLEKRKPVFKGR